MSDEPENLMLVYLRRLDAKMDRLSEDSAGLRARMTTVETQIGNLTGLEASHYAATAMRLDRIDARLERLERRADILADSP